VTLEWQKQTSDRKSIYRGPVVFGPKIGSSTSFIQLIEVRILIRWPEVKRVP